MWPSKSGRRTGSGRRKESRFPERRAVVFGRPKQEIDGKCGGVPGMESRPDYRDGRYTSDRYEKAYILPASEGIRGNQ